jgi:GNAT superfamily N-acetyltransferase
MELIDKSLSEPYSVFTYRYFLHQWPNLCYLALDGDKAVGVIVCKMDDHRGHLRGYIAMLVVDSTYRGQGLGKQRPRQYVWVPSKQCSSSATAPKARPGHTSRLRTRTGCTACALLSGTPQLKWPQCTAVGQLVHLYTMVL